MILIGIDPAYRENGFAAAMLDKSDEIDPLTFKVFDKYVHFLDWLANKAPEAAYVAVENSNLHKPVYRSSKATTFNQASALGVSVGKNQAASQIAADLLEIKYGKNNVLQVSPKGKTKVPGYKIAILLAKDILKTAELHKHVEKALRKEDCRSALLMLDKVVSLQMVKKRFHGIDF